MVRDRKVVVYSHYFASAPGKPPLYHLEQMAHEPSAGVRPVAMVKGEGADAARP